MTKGESLTKSLAPMGTASFFIFFGAKVQLENKTLKKIKKI